jgi:transposase InsO family protein
MPARSTRRWRSPRSSSTSASRPPSAGSELLIESTIGLYKTELVHRRAYGWDGRADLELATTRWVEWFNRQRLHEHLGYSTPIEIEAAYIQQQGLPRQAG